MRDRAPAGMAIAAGEYAWGLDDLQSLLAAGAVDVVQADVTRCGGITNMMRVDGLCRAHHVPFSAHCAPAISVHACCAMESAIHVEFFDDHVRIEQLLFGGAQSPEGGRLAPDPDRPGLGLELKRHEAARFAI